MSACGSASSDGVDITALEACGLWHHLERTEGDEWCLVRLDADASGHGVRATLETVSNKPLAALAARLDDSRIQFACVKLHGVDPRGTVVSKRAKFVFLSWVGCGVTRAQKAVHMGAKAAMKRLFSGHQLDVDLYDRTDLTQADLERRLRACGGAHQPDHFDFPAGNDERVWTAERQPTDAAQLVLGPVTDGTGAVSPSTVAVAAAAVGGGLSPPPLVGTVMA